jgi:hypothetical protein
VIHLVGTWELRSIIWLCKNFIQVSPPIQHAHNFSNVVGDAVKDDVRTRSDRSQSRTNFVSGSTAKWRIFEQQAGFADFPNDLVGVR